MSKETIAAFFKQLAADKPLQEEYCRARQRAVASAICEVAANHGCVFTREEIEDMLALEEGELGEKDLDKVAGGFGARGSLVAFEPHFNIGSFSPGNNMQKI